MSSYQNNETKSSVTKVRFKPTHDVISETSEGKADGSINVSLSKTFTSEYFVYVTIAILYVSFISMLIDRILDKEGLDKECNIPKGVVINDGGATIKKCKKLKDGYESSRYVYMLVIGVASILSGAYMTQSGKNVQIAGLGVSLGGLLAVIYETIRNWGKLSRDLKIVVLGVTLGIMIYGSTKFFD